MDFSTRSSRAARTRTGASLLSVMLLAMLVLSCRAEPKKAATLEQVASEINALIPEQWKTKIEFAPGVIDFKKHRFTLLLPKGWVPSQLDGIVVPPDNNIVEMSAVFGFNNDVSVRTQCGGDCGGIKDWKAASDYQTFEQYTTGRVRGIVLSDEATPNGRLMIFQREPQKGADVKVVPGDKARLVMRAWWEKNDTKYYMCQATLSDLSFLLAPAMAAACMTATVQPVPTP
jgi:hypothetical protein